MNMHKFLSILLLGSSFILSSQAADQTEMGGGSFSRPKTLV